jgi:proline dehydrogenase
MFTLLARSTRLKGVASRYGMRPGGFARRFIAGEHEKEAIEAARALQARGRLLTPDYLGESVATASQALAAAREYGRLIDLLVAEGIELNLSVKLTQLGLNVDRATCTDNLRRILEPARRHDGFVRIDMEGSAYTELTLQIFETMWGLDYRNVGVVLQSSLYRTDRDVARMNQLGARVRLVKGAYKEPPSVAYRLKADVDAAYLRQMRVLIDHGVYPAFATHDEAILRSTREYAAERGVGSDRYEFQLLYGIRRDLQAALIAGGSRVRVYVPFGQQWFPYFMRRLGERPANVVSVVSALLGEWRGPHATDASDRDDAS